jgi:hypothetical protein
MYEVGLALASRSPSSVLLVRDDTSRFLFDVSTIPHLSLNFATPQDSIPKLRNAIADRLREGSLLEDARVELAVAQLTDDEFSLLKIFGNLKPEHGIDLRHSIGDMKFFTDPTKHGLDGLLAKRLIKVFGQSTDGGLLYSTTEFGYAVARLADDRIQEFEVGAGTESDA